MNIPVCVCQYPWLCVCVCVCLSHWYRLLRLVCNSIRRSVNSALCVCETASWHLSVWADIVQQHVTAWALFFFVLGLFSCQWNLGPVMDYSWSDTNPSWHLRNGIPPYWDQLHRMLSPIVPYSKYYMPRFLPNSTWLDWTLAQINELLH